LKQLLDYSLCDFYLRQVNTVNGGDYAFSRFCHSVRVCAATWRHNVTSDVITYIASRL